MKAKAKVKTFCVNTRNVCYIEFCLNRCVSTYCINTRLTSELLKLKNSTFGVDCVYVFAHQDLGTKSSPNSDLLYTKVESW